MQKLFSKTSKRAVEIKCNLRDFIMPTIFLSVGILVLYGLPINNIYAASENSEIGQINEYLRSKHILTPGEQNKLSALIHNLLSKENKLSVLKDFSFKIIEKVERDKNELQYLLENLEKFTNDQYARTIGEVKKSDIKDCWNLFNNLQRDIEKSHSSFSSSRERLDPEYYLQIIRKNSVFLVGGGNSITISNLWESIKEVAKSFYLSWSKRKIELSERVKKYQKDLQSSSDILTYEEGEFIVKFNEVQASLRRLAADNSPDF